MTTLFGDIKLDELLSVKNNLQKISALIQEYECRYHRKPNSVKLLCATKGQSLEKIRAAIASGQTIFGENYLQEALEKITALANEKIEWHFIGPIQSNKTKKIAEHFSWVHSVDSSKIATRLNDQRPSHLSPLNICLEINISGEKSKSGILPDEAFALAEYCMTLPKLKLRGLMTIPKITHHIQEQRIQLRELKKLYDALIQKNINLDTLSMGMSDDLEAAIAEGATIVRIGTAIFGERN